MRFKVLQMSFSLLVTMLLLCSCSSTPNHSSSEHEAKNLQPARPNELKNSQPENTVAEEPSKRFWNIDAKAAVARFKTYMAQRWPHENVGSI